MKIKGYYTVEVKDKNGKLLRRLKGRSRSYVRQFIDILYTQFGSKTGVTVKDTGGIDRSCDYRDMNLAVSSAENNSDYGILVGGGTTAVTISDYNIESQYAHGTGANQMYHYAVTFTAPSVSGPVCSFVVQRVIGNQSGATITVREIGIGGMFYGDTGTRYALLVRDILASPLSVPDGGAITVTYTLAVSV